jgi:hypothetical protein
MGFPSFPGSRLITLAAAAALAAAPALAQSTVPAGPEFRVAENAAGHQRAAVAATAPDGTYLVVWESATGDGSGSGVFGRRFDRVGTPLGGEFLVNQTTTGEQTQPALTVDAAGRFTVAWTGDDGSGGGIFARQFLGGTPLGPEFQVNTYTTAAQAAPHASAGPSGLAIAWQSAGQDGDLLGVYGRLFSPAGAPVTDEIPVSNTTAGDQRAPVVAALDSGRYAAAWLSGSATTPSVFTRVFQGDGTPLADERVLAGPFFFLDGRNFVTITPGLFGSFHVGWWDHSTMFGKFGAHAIDNGVRVQQHSGDNVPVGSTVVVASAGQGADVRWEGAGTPHWTGFHLAAWTSTPDAFPCAVIPPQPQPNACPPAGPEDGAGSGVFARAVGPGITPAQVQVNTFTTGNQTRPAVAIDVYGNGLVTWQSENQDGSGLGVYAQRMGGLFPQTASVDEASNRVLDPGETATVSPSWLNRNGASRSFTGALFGYEGPAGATYSIVDSTAAYGPVPDGATQPCSECYLVHVSAPAVRPAPHWDSFLGETLDAPWLLHRVWTLHVGGSFSDVAPTSPFYYFTETMLHTGVSSGCAPGLFCPASPTSRDQMAALVLLARQGAGYVPPACATPVFPDVPASSPFCPFVEELVRRGVTAGCGGGNFCPADPVTRAQMAVFVLRTLDPAISPPPCGAPVFPDVPAASPFCPFVEELVRRGVTAGCGGGNFCPGDPVTRAQMAVFLTTTFGLSLY